MTDARVRYEGMDIMSKVCVLGLDGGTFAIIDYLVGQKRLPNFQRLLTAGSRATLLSTAPPLTWPAWASFYTGTNPGKTGAADLFKFRPGTYQLEPMNAGNLQGTPIWSLASDLGKRVCVYNVPVTYPAIPVNGVLISGLDAPRFNDRAIYPLELKDRLLAEVPDFAITYHNDAKYLVNHHEDPVGEWIKRLRKYLGMEIRVINYLMQMDDWDLFVAVLRSPDIIQHTMWREAERVIKGETVSEEGLARAEAVFGCYEAIDRELGESWLTWCSNRNLIIMSDHGFGQLRGKVCLNRVLADAGLLKFYPVSSHKRSRRYLSDKMQAHLPFEMKQKIKSFLGRDKSGRRWHTYVDVLVADIDWSQTRLCSIGGFGSLFVNLKGRDPLGTVGSEMERQAVLADAEAVLSEIKDPVDGLPLVTKCYRKEELYHGPLMSEIPDMVLDMRDWSYCPVTGTMEELAEESIIREPTKEWKQLSHTGTHRREGVLILHGPKIAHAKLANAQMVDVAPTIMNLMGLPQSRDFDGAVLEAALATGQAEPVEVAGTATAAGSGKAESATKVSTYTEEDENEVRKHLTDLGYL